MSTLESREVIRLGTSLVRVDLVCEAQLRHRVSDLGKTDSDPAREKADHTLAFPIATIDPIYQSSPDSDPESGGEVYMVGNGEKLLEKTVEEI
jgi:hypothetical protein